LSNLLVLVRHGQSEWNEKNLFTGWRDPALTTQGVAEGREAGQALNERDYGDISGLNKDDAREKWGEEQVHIWRRSYDVPPPGGESLKDTAARVLPYFEREILPRVLKGEKVLIAAHGNSLRALVMVLDKLSQEEILKVNIATGAPIVYKLDDKGNVLSKDMLIEREAH
jgi:2,3-bisphosphoglycerate-dependent phosphoglycerate mutase